MRSVLLAHNPRIPPHSCVVTDRALLLLSADGLHASLVYTPIHMCFVTFVERFSQVPYKVQDSQSSFQMSCLWIRPVNRHVLQFRVIVCSTLQAASQMYCLRMQDFFRVPLVTDFLHKDLGQNFVVLPRFAICRQCSLLPPTQILTCSNQKQSKPLKTVHSEVRSFGAKLHVHCIKLMLVLVDAAQFSTHITSHSLT